MAGPLNKMAIGLVCCFAAGGVTAEPFAPKQSPLPVPPPPGAVVLLAADGSHEFLSMAGGKINWPVEAGVLVSSKGDGKRSTNHIVSRLHFRDAHLHAEFMTPPTGTGNSGLYLHGNYELQIHGRPDKGAKLTDHAVGAVYGFHPPLEQAGRPAGEWQVYDIEYTAPRRDAEGQIVQEGAITAWLNGKLVQEHAKVGEPRSTYHPYRYGSTPYLQKIWEEQKRTSVGPVFLQDHANAVRFRNVWVVPLDDKAHFYEGDAERRGK